MTFPDLALVREAIELDGKNKYFAALEKYTEALTAISGCLLTCYRTEDLESIFTPESTAKKLVFVVNQCVDRINGLFKTCEEKDVQEIAASTITVGCGENGSKSQDQENGDTASKPVHDFSSVTGVDPVVVAIEKNKQLVAAHVERLKRAHLPTSAQATLNMSLQRQLMENLELAKKEKRELEMKKEKARQSALESLEKCQNTVNLAEEEKQFIVDVRVFESDCHELRLFSYELNGHEKHQVGSVEFGTICDHYLDAILSNPDHPFCIRMRQIWETRREYLHHFQPDTFTTGAIQTVLADDIAVLLPYFQHSLLVKHDLKLKSSQMKSRLQDAYLGGLMHALEICFRRILHDDVKTIKSKLNVNIRSEILPISFSESSSIIVDASKTFRSLSDALTPKAMLDILVSTCKVVSCQEAESESEMSRLDTDHLICTLAAIIVESGSPEIVVWAAIMEEFIDWFGDSAVAEEGFCLASLQAAVRYICTA